jgi:hypothetical protein
MPHIQSGNITRKTPRFIFLNISVRHKICVRAAMMSDDPLLSAARPKAEAGQLQAAPLHRGLLSLLGTAARHWSRARQVPTNKQREILRRGIGIYTEESASKKQESVVAISLTLNFSAADPGGFPRIPDSNFSIPDPDPGSKRFRIRIRVADSNFFGPE